MGGREGGGSEVDTSIPSIIYNQLIFGNFFSSFAFAFFYFQLVLGRFDSESFSGEVDNR